MARHGKPRIKFFHPIPACCPLRASPGTSTQSRALWALAGRGQWRGWGVASRGRNGLPGWGGDARRGSVSAVGGAEPLGRGGNRASAGDLGRGCDRAVRTYPSGAGGTLSGSPDGAVFSLSRGVHASLAGPGE